MPGPRRIRAQRGPIRQGLPNLLTTVALCSALAAIHFAIKEDWDRTLAAVAVSAIFDALDGRAARWLNAATRFGAVFDSLSDFLAFGVAPGFILHRWLLKDADIFGLAAVMTYVLCCALRLARFTAMAEDEPHDKPPSRYFVGMPAPSAAGAALIPLLLASSSLVAFQPPTWAVVANTFLVALLMISHVPMYSMKTLRIRRRHLPFALVAVGLLIVMAIRDAWLTLAVMAGAYLLSAPVSVALNWRRRPFDHAEEDDAAEDDTQERASSELAPAAGNGRRGGAIQG